MRLEVPDDWLVEPAPNVSFAAASPVDVDGMHANIVVSIRRIDADLSLEQVTDLVGAQLGEVPGVTDHGNEYIDLEGRPASMRRFRIESADTGVTIEQCQLICVVGCTELVADAVTATLTYSPSSSPELVEDLILSLLSLRAG